MHICFAQVIHHGGDRLHSAAPPPCRRPPRPQILSIRTFNICDGRGFKLAQAIWEVQIGSFKLMILTETKVTDQAYCHSRLGYDVV